MRNLPIIILSALIFSACQISNPNITPANVDINSETTTTPPVTITPTIEASPSAATKTAAEIINLKPNQKMYATLKTTLGNIKIELFADKAPNTVANFVGLSEGTKDWTDPKTGQKMSSKPLYNGVIFHRIIKDFMIQGGDPLGTGTGGPGYSFADEFDPKLTFDKPGILAMANSGPNTNGSQFFITTVPTAWLNGKHTIFGQVIDGLSVLATISATPVNASDQPITPVVIEKITIERK
jgi:peptidyl-prolyl cis-trans isomerase A (cyclophilin A)